MFPVGQYTCLTVICKPYTSIYPPEHQSELIQHHLTSFRCNLVICRWKENIASLYVSGGSICMFDNTIWVPHQDTATGKPVSAYPTAPYFVPVLSGICKWKENITALHVSSESIHTLVSIISIINQHSATGTPGTAYLTCRYFFLGLSGQ
jgi:hypothetical protein